MSATLYCGDVRTVLASLPDGSVQTCVTSPPYFGLRDYGHEGQLGLEPTPDAYVAGMVAVFREVRRVLRDDGTLWLNIGDSYAGSWGNQGRKEERGTQRPINGGMLTPVHDGRYPTTGSNTGAIPEGATYKAKDLLGIPWLVAFALRADGWYLRSDIIWAKPNPMPESVTDRPTKAHEYVFLLTKSARYYYDAAAIQEDAARPERAGKPLGYWGGPNSIARAAVDGRAPTGNEGARTPVVGATSRNARTVWSIATQPYSGAHFATMPEELARRCILAGSSAKACEHCGAPWERVTSRGDVTAPTFKPLAIAESGSLPDGPGIHRNMGGRYQKWLDENPMVTTGWQPTCACADNTGRGKGVVLDPFGGSGTTAAVAVGHGRSAIHIDLNPAYIELARTRIGPMLCTGAEAVA
jgi:DNA modification methylase